MKKFKLALKPPKLKVKVRVNRVARSTAALATRLVAASQDCKSPIPTMEVKFLKTLWVKTKRMLFVEGKATAQNEKKSYVITGNLFHWGGEVLLVCHRSPWSPNEWMVSEYTTGANSHFNVKGAVPAFNLKSGNRPTEAEARFEAIFLFQRYGMKRVLAYYKALPKLNSVSLKMARYIDRDWNWTERER